MNSCVNGPCAEDEPSTQHVGGDNCGQTVNRLVIFRLADNKANYIFVRVDIPRDYILTRCFVPGGGMARRLWKRKDQVRCESP